MGGCCGKKRSTDELVYNDPKDPEASTIFVARAKDISEDKFTAVKISEEKSILVGKFEKKFYAIGDKCPHAGRSLADAPVRMGRVRCLEHGSCFDIETGDIEDFPGFECIPTYKVEVRMGSVYVKVNPKRMPTRLLKPMTRLKDDSIQIVIIGTGAAGYTCAQTLREEGFEGRITMISEDKYLPYDRTKLTTVPNCEFDSLKIRRATFFKENDIELLLDKAVTKIDKNNHFVYLAGSSKPQLMYDNLFIAVGQSPRRYAETVTGSRLSNIVTLRTFDDHVAICAKATGKEVVIAGSSFLSMELAEMLSPLAKSIHVLSRGKYPYGPVLGEVASIPLLNHFLQTYANVIFHPTDEVHQFIGTRTEDVTAVYTVKKQTISCQLVVLGIGALPNTDFLINTGIKMNPVDSSIIVNQLMETSLEYVYAGGDCCSFPFYMCSRDRAVVAHWQMACIHGKVAALNMLGRVIRIGDVVPHFTTSVAGKNVVYIGYGEGYDEVLVFGTPNDLNFCCVYRRRRRLSAVCCVGCELLAAQLMLLFETEKEWIVDLPELITKAFPGPPMSADAYHAIKHETHTQAHDASVNKVAPIPVQPFELERRNRNYLRTNLIPIGFDLVTQGHEDEDPDKTLALEILNMRRDQEDRRRAEKIRHGRILGNVALEAWKAEPPKKKQEPKK